MDGTMEVDFIPSGKSEEDDTIEANDINNEISDFEVERCGICMDVIVDRGVLDCCQHWFCFVCIDNWATITNLCPLCQNEFQLITCVPVYDTIGSNRVDEESFYRDDDWCIEGKSTISFPSYYIDENAVICLDGDGCKIRNGSGFTEGDTDHDTSIACDSCDTWYHAFCVEFDPEDTSDSTWLCPRCGGNEQKNSINDIDPRLNGQFDPVNALVAQGFSRKVSVSVADAGETALVVSMIGGNQVNEEQTDNNTPSTEMIENSQKTENFILASEVSNHDEPTPLIANTAVSLSLGAKQLELSLSHDTSICTNEIKTEPSSLDYPKSLSRGSSDVSRSRNKMSNNEFNIGLHLGLPVGTFLSADAVNNGNQDRGVDDKQQCIHLEEHLLKADNVVLETSQELSGTVGMKRKRADCSYVQTCSDDGDITATITPKNCTDQSKSDDTGRCLAMALVPKDASLKRVSDEQDVKVDIMGIVRGTNRRHSKGLACLNSNDKLPNQRDSLTGLRVKKIMRRTGEDQESSILVQKLRFEIREAVRNKCSKDFGENLLDTKLLAAFRAAVSGPKTESEKRLSALAVKAKKSMLQRGKVRDSLTKKIYGVSNGRRKRAWDRDCEIEFWKHRCMRATKPEKIATLKSVLDLLRNSSQNPDTKQGSECQPTNPILSRLYLADTSVFPRNDDIKPLSALKPSFNLEQKKEPLSETGKVSPKAGTSLVGNAGNNCSISGTKSAAATGKGNHSGHSAASVGHKIKPKKEVSSTSNDARNDKRKWALEVLARKTADPRNVANGKDEDLAVLKGNYPLLAQLPMDMMRPELAPSRHNKIPISVRQAQLYRLTEHFLKRTNLPVTRRTAETELAIADAINIEKEVADRSNSKLVYLNLCSQEMMHRTNTDRLSTTAESDHSSPPTVSDNGSELVTELEADPAIEEALRNAGLLSDSPVNSQSYRTDDLNEVNDTAKEFRDEEPDNVIEMDAHPDLDIYGDFEYDLEDENYITTKATKVPKPPDEGESKMKFILSTLNSQRLIDASDVEHNQRLENVELQKDASCSPKNSTDVEVGTAGLEGETEEATAVAVDPWLGKEAEEPSLAEYEELYGPEKLPVEALSNKHFIPTSEFESEKKDSCNDEHSLPVQAGKESALKCGNKVNGTEVDNIHQTSCSPRRKEKHNTDNDKQSASANSVAKKVETYIKEHIRPLCKSGVITAEQYRWAVLKTTEKVMKYHSNNKNANFLIKEGEKVKKLAEQYVEAAQRKGTVD